MKQKLPRGIKWRADRNRWQHRLYHHGTSYVGLHRSLEEAKAALAADRARVEKLKRVPANALSAVVTDFLVRSKQVGKSEWRIKALIYNFKKHIVPHFGPERAISDITFRDVERFVAAQKARGVKNSTIWHYVVDLSAVFNHYIHTYQVAITNPVKLANLQSIKNRRAVKPPFDPRQVEIALACLNRPDDFPDWLYVCFGALTGARRGEINRTTWGDLFLEDVDNAWYKIPGTKTAASSALNPIPPTLARALRAWREINAGALVFPGRSAQTLGKQIMRRSYTFKKIAARTGIKLTSKDLRDYYASMVETDHVGTLKELMRHASLSTTTTYMRKRAELMRAAVKNLGANFGATLPSKEGQKRHKTTFQGNQHVDRESWLSAENKEEKCGGGGRSRTYDAADMSRVLVDATKH